MRLAAPALALAALFALPACGGGRVPSSLPHPLAGGHAPEFREFDIDERDVGVPGGMRTKVTVIDFWASWCGGCQETIPFMDAMYRDKKEDGLMVIGVSVDEHGDDAISFARTLRTSFPIVLDPGMRIAGSYGVGQVPLTFVIDRRGIVRWVGRSPGDAQAAVNALLSE